MSAPNPVTINVDGEGPRWTTVHLPGQDFSWVKEIRTVDAVDRDQVSAVAGDPRWLLLAVGSGQAGQTTLTFAAPSRPPPAPTEDPAPSQEEK